MTDALQLQNRLCEQGRQIKNRLNEFTRDEDSWERLRSFLESQGVEVESKPQVRRMILSTMDNICKGYISLNSSKIDTEDFLNQLAQQGTLGGEIGSKVANAVKNQSGWTNMLGASALTTGGIGLAAALATLMSGGTLTLPMMAALASAGLLGGTGAVTLGVNKVANDLTNPQQNNMTNRWLNWLKGNNNATPAPMPELDAANQALGYYASDSNVFEGVPALHNYLKEQGRQVMKDLTVALNKVAKHTSGRMQKEASNAGSKCHSGGDLAQCAEALYSFCQVEVPEDLQLDDDTRVALQMLAIMCAKQAQASNRSKDT